MWGIAILATISLPVLARFFPAVAMPARWEVRWDAINLLMFGAVLAILLGIQSHADRLAQGNLIGVLRLDLAAWPDALIAMTYLVVADGISYGFHRLLHHRRLWHLHAWHHSPQHVNLVSGLRGAPMHIVSTGLPYILTGIVVPVNQMGNVALGIVGFILLVKNSYTHTNVRVPGQSLMERLGLITPRSHLVHHRANRAYTDSNFGFLFNIWDRLFGTWVDPATVDDSEAFGLDYAINPRAALFGLKVHALEPLKSAGENRGAIPLAGEVAEPQ